MIAKTHVMEKVELRMRIAALEGMWTEVDIALCNAECLMRDHNEDVAQKFYARLRERLHKVFVQDKLTQ